MRYTDLGPDYYDRQRDVRRQIAHHVGKLGALGFEVTLARIPEPDPDGTSPAQAVLAAHLSAHRTMINGSALCAAPTVTERD
jgi:hypothetical protein